MTHGGQGGGGWVGRSVAQLNLWDGMMCITPFTRPTAWRLCPWISRGVTHTVDQPTQSLTLTLVMLLHVLVFPYRLLNLSLEVADLILVLLQDSLILLLCLVDASVASNFLQLPADAYLWSVKPKQLQARRALTLAEFWLAICCAFQWHAQQIALYQFLQATCKHRSIQHCQSIKHWQAAEN